MPVAMIWILSAFLTTTNLLSLGVGGLLLWVAYYNRGSLK